MASDGTDRAHAGVVAGVRRFEDLIAWQLGVELRERVVKLTDSGGACGDRDFREQIRDSARSVPRNIAEGFARFNPKEFEQFARVARGSLTETQNHIMDGVQHGYFTPADAAVMLSLVRRCGGATTRLMQYLHSCKGKAPAGWDVPDK